MILASVQGAGLKTRPRSFLIKSAMYTVGIHWLALGLVTLMLAMRFAVTRRYIFWLMRGVFVILSGNGFQVCVRVDLTGSEVVWGLH